MRRPHPTSYATRIGSVASVALVALTYQCTPSRSVVLSPDVVPPLDAPMPELPTLLAMDLREDDSVDALAMRLNEDAIGWLGLPPSGDEAFEKREGESVAAVRLRIAEVAKEAATLAFTEKPVWAGDNGTRTARLLMCVAFFESGFRGYVDDGRCDDPAWRATPTGRRMMRRGDCDGGHARSLWQLHGFDGTRSEAIREALRRIRTAVSYGLGMRAYTGERDPAAPKAQQRLLCASRG